MTWARVAARQEKDLWCRLVWISQELNGLSRRDDGMQDSQDRVNVVASRNLSAQIAKGETEKCEVS